MSPKPPPGTPAPPTKSSLTDAGKPGKHVPGPFARYKLEPVKVQPVGLGDDVSAADRAAWEKDWELISKDGFYVRNMLAAGDYGDISDWKKYIAGYSAPTRPGLNSTGKEALLTLNVHRVKKFNDTNVHQFDIIITAEKPGTEMKRGLIKAIWECPTMQRVLGPGWIWNGDKIAWHKKGIPELERQKTPANRHQKTIQIDMDVERQSDRAIGNTLQQVRAPRGESQRTHDNKFNVQIRYTKTVNLAIISHFLAGTCDFDDGVLEAITLLNHILRESPAKRLNAFKNSFFPSYTDSSRYDIGQGVYALKGAFQSVRLAYGGQLMVNVDVAHSTFYIPQRLDYMAHQAAEVGNTGNLISLLQKSQRDPPHGAYKDSPTFKKLKVYLRKLKFHVKYPGMSDKTKGKRFIVKDVVYDNARSKIINFKDRATGRETQMNVKDYFQRVYGYHLEQAGLPLIECTKKGVFYPMEVCHVEEGQRYPFKLDERQTADMIKFAVSRPNDRLKSIKNGISLLDWPNDKILQQFDIQIGASMVETKARVLDPPKVLFAGNKTEQPGLSGRWRVDGKQFLQPNAKPIKNWGVCIVTANRPQRDAVTEQDAMAFMKDLITAYKAHGGRFANTQFATARATEENVPEAVDNLMAAMRARGLGQKEYPDLMIFILPRKNTEMYHRLKRCADLKWGSISQCVQGVHVKKRQGQYISNVLMKINAKLGGQSFKAMPLKGEVAQRGGRYFNIPTMVIGADVSHPSPGSLGSSMAALTVSMDREAIRYGAAVQSNGFRLEMITTWNWQDMLGPMAREWISTVGNGMFPRHIYYFRDGVSEGQYEHVINQEVRDMYAVFKALDPTADGSNVKALKFTVVVCSKRHHIRFFPRAGTAAADKNANAVPGTLVERDVTSVRDFDFYLNSHSAIQGTARPCHYAVIMDQANVPVNFLQNMIYEHCYQYIRSSTPVSLFPAVYYAHLASRRAVSHERQGNKFGAHRSSEQKERYMLLRARAECDQTGKIMTPEAIAKLKEYTTNEYPPCIPTCNPKLWTGMWYI